MPNGTTDDWEADWRKGVNGKLDRLVDGIAELVSRMDVADKTIKDMQASPEGVRNWVYLWLVAAGVGLSALCGGSGLLVSVVTLILHLAGH